MRAADTADLEALLAAVAERDIGAFRRLYDLTSPKLLGLVLRIVKTTPAAEDVLQDVFLRIWQNAATFSPQAGTARAWMNTIARHRAIDVLRQGGTAPSATQAEIDWFARLAENRDREREIVGAASLRHCLGTLDPQQRHCVLLAYYDGFSREELAARFDRPVNTIKTWLHRSLNSLRICLDGTPE